MIKTCKSEKEKFSSELTKANLVYQYLSRWSTKYLKKFPSDRRYNLTTSESIRFVWYRVPKVASRTIFDYFERANIEWTAERTLSCHYPVSYYKNYLKFAFVRNPWDRLVSCWLDKVCYQNYFQFEKDKREKMRNFKNFILYVQKLNLKTCDNHLRLQSALIDLNHVDFIGRFENFENDFRTILNKLNVEEISISRKNQRKKRTHYHDYYDEETRQLVAEIYRLDIQIFNYKY